MELAAAITATVLQMGPPFDPVGVDPAVGLGGGAFGTFVSTLVVGAILLVLAPRWTRTRIRRVTRSPVGNFAYGFAVLLLAIFVIVLLAITLVGLFVAIPLAFLLYLAWTVGAVIAYLAIADRFVDVDDDWVVALVAAAALNGVLTLTGIGALLSFCIGAAGFGTLLRG
ncbi:hypothetical protein [Halorubellus sp. PRR65]|uniref:hypothetical protein n=1 Tax=Halorubellus sp. PRR65 TaxID=3098148 RepID=UPI002B25A6B3|nr:hypothetical protein [Halorubellus sp. PRR65]